MPDSATMIDSKRATTKGRLRFPRVEDYEDLIGAEEVDRLLRAAERLEDMHIVNVSSTYYGGGVATLLSSIILLMNGAGLKTGWRVIQGSPDFFNITKKMHNALQGDEINLTDRKKEIYEEVIYENAVRNHLDHDMVIIHDPQPLPLIKHYRRNSPWIWRCHIDLTAPDRELWKYLKGFVECYDAVVMSLPEYRRELQTPQMFFMPAIDPFSIANRDLSDAECMERLSHYGIPDDRPIIVQVSRFDRWKDPAGVIEMFKLVRQEVDATLVLLGNAATDDPEGAEVYESLLKEREERIIIMSEQDTALVNALQRKAAVVVQNSIREGFGLTVAEAMWKEAAVIGTRVGGIRHQIVDGENGFLVNSGKEMAARAVQLLRNEDLRRRIGRNARETVRQKFLLTRLMGNWLDLFDSFETKFTLRGTGAEWPSGQAT